MLRNLFTFWTLTSVKSHEISSPIIGITHMIPGSPVSDQNGCVTDGGYSWCEITQKCIRPWEEECPIIGTTFCPSSNIQMCRQVCDTPVCPGTECAMRTGNCCDYFCSEQTQTPIDSLCSGCPPAQPCPNQLQMIGCRYNPPIYDHCGCSSGCGTIDCSHNNKVGVGGTCGGFMHPGLGVATICEDGLECVNTMDPLIADAPGTCQILCNSHRGTDGICEEDVDMLSVVPWNCAVWYDGCNSCSVSEGVLGGCTLMMCFTNNTPYCSSFYAGELVVGDLCYRFCEDGSKTQIDRRKDCPLNTNCMVENIVSFDTCSDVMKCLPPSLVGH